MTERDPYPLKDTLAEVGRQLGLSSLGTFDIVVASWSEVVGPVVERHARVRSLQDGECVVEVDEPAWATRVRYLGPELRRDAAERALRERDRDLRDGGREDPAKGRSVTPFLVH